MQALARVIEIRQNGYAGIEYTRTSACGHDCTACGACRVATAKAVAKNAPNAQPGDLVVVHTPSGFVLLAAFIVYILPLLLFFTGYFAFNVGQVFKYILGAAFFALGIVFALVFNKISAKNKLHVPQILRIDNE